jgi:putative methionine-R-sulfoxide reductase with GAF domain
VKRDRLRGALEAVDRVLNRGGDADDVLRAVVTAVYERARYDWVGISFVEGDELVLGPTTGAGRGDGERLAVPIRYEERAVGELAVLGSPDEEDRAFLERVATLVSPYCLVGWDTGGARWDP